MPGKIVFLDRDGVLNEEIGDYVYRLEDFKICEGVPQALRLLKDAGFTLVVVTNQGGIGRGIYTRQHMQACHDYLHENTGSLIDAFYYSPYHRSVTKSLLSKPNSVMLEKGLHCFKADPAESWLVGDAERDLEAAEHVGVRGILVPTVKEQTSARAVFVAKSLFGAAQFILKA